MQTFINAAHSTNKNTFTHIIFTHKTKQETALRLVLLQMKFIQFSYLISY